MQTTPFLRTVEKRYRLFEKIGEGGMGSVYRALDRLVGNIVAFKRVSMARPLNSSDTQGNLNDTHHQAMILLAQEFRTVVGLRHPHILTVYSYGFDANREPYFTMQLVQNAQTITEYGADQQTPEKVRLIVEMLQALSYLHRRGIIHRDLKPANVLVDQSGAVKVMDFGLALNRMQTSNELGAAVGTLAYMAPELITEQPATIASDLYAVGIIAYELFAGKHPFETPNFGLMLLRILNHIPDTQEFDPKLAVVIDCLLAKDPAERYQNADEVISALCEATDYPVPKEDSALRDSFLQAARFVGRSDEFAKLQAALEDVLKGHGSTWLVGGESGVGKSRLMEEIRIAALVEGALALRGQAVEGGGLRFQVWREPMRRLAIFSDLTDHEVGILKEIVPDIEALLEREVSDMPAVSAAIAQQRLILAVVDVFKRQTQPIVLLLEDLQWTHESLEVLKLLNQIVEGLPILIVGSYRNDERPNLPQELPGAQVITLSRFERATIAELSEAMLGDIGKQPPVISLLERESEGNVFFLIEVLRALAEELGSLRDIGKRQLPQSVFAMGVQAITRRRLEHLRMEDQPLLRLAAVLGREIKLDLLRQVDDEWDYDDWLLRCANAALITVGDGGRWVFAHDKFRQGILYDLAKDEFKRLNSLAAHVIEEVYADSPDYIDTLLKHWHDAGNRAKEVEYHMRAAERQYLTGSFRGALTHIGYSLIQSPPEATQAQLHRIEGDCYIGLADNLKAESAYTRSLELARQSEDKRAEAAALFGLTRVADAQGKYELVRKHLESSMAISTDIGDRKTVASNLRGMGWNAAAQGKYDLAWGYLEEGLAICNEIQDQSGASRTYAAMSFVLGAQSSYEDALGYIEKSIEVSLECGDRYNVARALRRQGWLLGAQGEVARARTYILESQAISRQMGEWHGIAACLDLLAILAILGAEYEKAQHYAEESLTIGRQIGEKRGVARSMSLLGLTAQQQGKHLAAQARLEESLTIRREIGYQQGIVSSLNKLGFVYLATGETTEAQVMLSEALKIADHIGADSLRIEALLGYARLRLETGDAERAAEWQTLIAKQQEALSADIKQLRLEPLAADLKAKLSADDFKAAQERGKALKLESVVRLVLSESSAPTS
jgi:tetratricopeptide (TPR) repeat protein